MRNSEEWERVLNQMTENSQPKPRVTLGTLISALISVAAVSAFGGMALMLLNMVVNSAWPNLDVLRPGIGYRHGAAIFAIWFIWFGFKTQVANNITKGDG